MKKKILCVSGTRADYGLLKPVISFMRRSKKIEPKVLATGMHTLKKFGNTVSLIKNDGLPLEAVVKISEKDHMLEALNKEISGIFAYCRKEDVGAILVLGDRDEAFAAAVVGIHLDIPVIHISGGDVSGPTVDHYLRNAITVFSKLHLVQTLESKKNVLKLGASPVNVFVVGSLGLENLQKVKLLSRLELGEMFGLDTKRKWFLFSLHPTPFEDRPIPDQINPALAALKSLAGEKIIIYPNSDTGGSFFIKKIEAMPKKKDFHIVPNLKQIVYFSLLKQCDVLIGNTSSGLTEAGFLKTPFVNIGNRQRGRERGANVISATYNASDIARAIKIALSKKFVKKMKKSRPVYKGGRVASNMVKLIENFIIKNSQ